MTILMNKIWQILTPTNSESKSLMNDNFYILALRCLSLWALSPHVKSTTLWLPCWRGHIYVLHLPVSAESSLLTIPLWVSDTWMKSSWLTWPAHPPVVLSDLSQCCVEQKNHTLSPAQITDPQNCNVTNGFKALSFGIYYVTINNLIILSSSEPYI